MPEVSTVVEQGYPRFSIAGGLGFLGPKDLDAALRERIAADVHVILSEPQVRERLADLGYVARGSRPRNTPTCSPNRPRRGPRSPVPTVHDLRSKRSTRGG